MAGAIPTLIQLAIALLPVLLDAALKALEKEKGKRDKSRARTATDDSDELRIVLEELAAIRFEKTFGYKHTDKRPPGAIGDGASLQNMCSLNHPEEAPGYIRDVVMTSLAIPEWMKVLTAADLNAKAAALLKQPLATDWSFDKYDATFEATLENQQSFKANAILVYVNAGANKNSADQQLCVIQFLGVYYPVQSQKSRFRNDVQLEAFSTAETLTGSSNVNTEDNLKTALRIYAESKWKEQFDYEYRDTPGDFEGGAAATLVRHGDLLYLPEGSEEDTANRVTNFVNVEFFGAINLEDENDPDPDRTKVKDKGISDLAKAAMLELVSSVIQKPSPGQWAVRSFNHSWQPLNPGLNVVKGNAAVYIFFAQKNTDTGDLVSVTYVFIHSCFYEVKNTLDVVTREIYEELCGTLKDKIPNYQPIGAHDDYLELNNILFEYSKLQFEREFDVTWDGVKTDIPDKTAMKLQTYRSVFQFDEWDPSMADIEARVGSAAFRKEGTQFPWGPQDVSPDQTLQGRLFNDLCNEVKSMAARAGANTNVWLSYPYKPSFFPDPAIPGNRVAQYTLFVFTHAHKAARGVTVDKLICYYFPVFWGEPIPIPPFRGD